MSKQGMQITVLATYIDSFAKDLGLVPANYENLDVLADGIGLAIKEAKGTLTDIRDHSRSHSQAIEWAFYALSAEGGKPRCRICNRVLDQPNDPSTDNCGGDCVKCMADSGDPDCIKAMEKLSGSDKHEWPRPEFIQLTSVAPLGPTTKVRVKTRDGSGVVGWETVEVPSDGAPVLTKGRLP